MTRQQIEIAGFAHDHLAGLNGKSQRQINMTLNVSFNNQLNASDSLDVDQDRVSALSTIAISRRHPMCDSLLLIKRFRPCLNGYSLELPTTDLKSHPSSAANGSPTSVNNQNQSIGQEQMECRRTKLVSMYLDEDDPLLEGEEKNCKHNLLAPEGEIVHVPMNGLLERLDKYNSHGVSIDSRVYAFAMGLKTAERILNNSSIKEVQETPQI